MKHLYIITLFSIIVGIPLHAADDVDKQLLNAVKSGNAQQVADILAQGNVNIDAGGYLHWAALYGHIDIVTIFCKKGASLNKGTSLIDNHYLSECTPLHYAASSNHKDVVSILLNNGANPKIRNDFNLTPAEVAQYHNHIDIVQFIKSYENTPEIKEPDVN